MLYGSSCGSKCRGPQRSRGGEVGGLGLGTLSNRGRHCESAIGGGEFSVAGYVDPPAAGRYSALAN